MQRFFLPGQPLVAGQTVSLDAIAHQLQHVLRLSVGDPIILLDGAGQEALTDIATLTRDHATGAIRTVTVCRAEPRLHLTLYQCSLKQDKFEWLLQKATELGVSRFVPVISARSIVRPAEALHKKYDRWRAIIREAAEQSGRGRLPVLENTLSWAEAVKSLQGHGYVPWEEADTAPGLGAAVGAAAGPGADAAAGCTLSPSGSSDLFAVSLLIGPEGGLTHDEIDLAQTAGWQPVSLGPRILRAETAALAAMTIALEHSRELG
jgi:16S rRNA (uracil1498-N3)-methyltransferase